MSPFFELTAESIQSFVAQGIVAGVGVGIFLVVVTLVYGRRS